MQKQECCFGVGARVRIIKGDHEGTRGVIVSNFTVKNNILKYYVRIDIGSSNITFLTPAANLEADEDSEMLYHIYNRYERIRIETITDLLIASEKCPDIKTLREQMRLYIKNNWRNAFNGAKSFKEFIDKNLFIRGTTG